jgi:hypothetical protein
VTISPSQFEKCAFELLRAIGVDPTEPRRIAEAIRKMSDFYIANPAASTPWSEKWAQVAQISYYLPLNFYRALRAYQQCQELGFANDFENLIDFGSGLGAGSLPWLCEYPKRNYHFIEENSIAAAWHKKILQSLEISEHKLNWSNASPREIRKNTLGIFSYSLTELIKFPNWIFDLDNILFIEPSTQEDGRRLMTLRQELITAGFKPWAPCTHAGACPLLTQSKTDWCHDRVAIELSDWLSQIEVHLPFKNRTLTHSYLALSRATPPQQHLQARVVGDMLPEKGKTRLLICRNSDREYLSWLNREGKPQEVKRGVRLEIQANWQKVGNEIRPAHK